jgi:Na+-driven multidrug efflux pump
LRPSHLIAFNATISYAQSLVALMVGLFTARWVLEALGAADLGLFSVVGSIILLISFVNTALSLGVSRFYAYSIGKGKNLAGDVAHNDLVQWFNTAFVLHFGLGILICVVGWPSGEFTIRHWLNIPEDRIESCVLVFRFSIFAAFCGIISVPFVAMFVAHQKIAQASFFKMLQNLLVLALAWVLLSVDSNRLVFYGAGMAAIAISIKALLVARATWIFPSCRLRPVYFWNRDCLSRLFSYVGWKFLGTACVASRDGGLPVMVNMYFGPVMNAAFNIANSMSMHASSLATSLQSAFQPAIVAAEGTGDRARMIAMSLKVCRYGSLLVLLFIVPLGIEMKTILDVWLKQPPPHTTELCQWILAMLLLEKMTSGAMIAVNAYGKIAMYEIIQGATFLLGLPILWLLHRQGVGPSAIGLALFISMAVYCLGRLAFAKALVSFPLTSWIRKVAMPVALICLSGILLGFITQQSLQAGWIRLLIIVALCGGVSLSLGVSILLSKAERGQMASAARDMITRRFAKATQRL